MAKFDVYERRGADGYLLDCQADLLQHLSTRFVTPLLPPPAAPRPLGRLHPVLAVRGSNYVMATHLAAGVPLGVLGARVGSLEDQSTRIMNALDMLISGY